jgi:anti-sigma B factor antagonist
MILSCDVTPAPDHVLVVVSGALDFDSGPVLRETLRDLDPPPGTPVLVDLEQVPFIDSAGLSVLIAGMKQLRGAGCDLRLVGTNPWLVRIMRITGLWKVMPLAASVDEALRDQAATVAD